MRWKDEGIVIATRKYGDKNLIVSLFTQNYGKRRGLTRLTKSNSYKFQVNNLLDVEWGAKLPESLGFFKCEIIESSFHYFFHDKLKNIAIIAFTSMLENILPENEANKTLYEKFKYFINVIKNNTESWQVCYLSLELTLLTELGFKLDLSKCAVTGTTENLKFISTRTGRAVSQDIGTRYKDKIFPFPRMLHNAYHNNFCCVHKLEEFQLGLKITGYFLDKCVFSQLGIPFPELRKFMMNYLY
ncbi:DNA repair protein RecO [Wolbachia endosymbiont of Pentidionis agamae]|uniref:DNA repair protein RecO n=1 Tax=Wolbachia endosymbiont of Pentidionis agamae TaxID=3110435 RepID=UPI002FD4C552